VLLLSALTPLVVAGAAGAHEAHVPIAKAADVAEPCPGDPLSPQRVVTGELDSELQGGYVLIPFDVPAGTTAVRVKYCYDQPETPASPERHTLDLGLYGPRADPGTPWGVEEFRGWGGSSHPDVTVSPEGFSTEAEYEADPDGACRGRRRGRSAPDRLEPASGRSSWGSRRSSRRRAETSTARWPTAWRSS